MVEMRTSRAAVSTADCRVSDGTPGRDSYLQHDLKTDLARLDGYSSSRFTICAEPMKRFGKCGLMVPVVTPGPSVRRALRVLVCIIAALVFTIWIALQQIYY
jgi:hypothetical protein